MFESDGLFPVTSSIRLFSCPAQSEVDVGSVAHAGVQTSVRRRNHLVVCSLTPMKTLNCDFVRQVARRGSEFVVVRKKRMTSADRGTPVSTAAASTP